MTQLYGPIDPLVTAPRYTTVATVKGRLRIPDGSAAYDDRVERAIISAELGIDYELGRSFPDVGLGLGSGIWRYDGTGAVPPDIGSALRTASTAVYLDHRVTLTNERPPKVNRDLIKYLAISQPGGHRVVQGVTAIDDVDTYEAYTTVASSGDWAGFVVGAPITVQALAALGPTGIPEPIAEAATAIAVAIYKAGDAPTGTAGSDDWIGSLDVSELIRAELRGNPLLRGFHTSWGIA